MLKIVRFSLRLGSVTSKLQNATSIVLAKNQTSYSGAQLMVDDIKEVSVDWKYIDRLIPSKIVPSFPVKEEYPSGWKPPANTKPETPYFVKRTANHLLPVYVKRTKRGQLVITYIRHIDGNIWELEKDVRKHLESGTTKPIIIQVHEPAGIIKIRREYLEEVEQFLYSKGF